MEAFQTYFPIQTQESNSDMYEKEMPEAAEKELAEPEIPKLGAARAAYQVGWNSDTPATPPPREARRPTALVHIIKTAGSIFPTMVSRTGTISKAMDILPQIPGWMQTIM